MISQLYQPFRHWSDGGAVYVLSDTHFADIDCKLMSEDWPEPHRQIRLINDLVKPCDTLVLLGDVGAPFYMRGVRTKRRVLITGNHDMGASAYVDLFDEIYEGPLFVTPKLVLSHEPVELPFATNVHGHVHDGVMRYDNRFGCHCLNLAANVCGYVPVNLGKEIEHGLLAASPGIHRLTIDAATERKQAGIGQG